MSFECPAATLRPALAGEAALLTDIAISAKSHWPYAAEQINAWRDTLRVTEDEIARFPTYLAESAGQVVGFVLLMPADDNWQLEHLWVAPSQMRRGIGKQLVARAVELAAQGGAQALAIDADPYAEVFYLACGATRVSVIAAPIPGDAQRIRPQLLLALRDTCC